MQPSATPWQCSQVPHPSIYLAPHYLTPHLDCDRSPMKLCPILLHEHDEYVPVTTFLDGCGVYESIIPALTEC